MTAHSPFFPFPAAPKQSADSILDFCGKPVNGLPRETTFDQLCKPREEGTAVPFPPPSVLGRYLVGFYCASRYIKVTIWARVQFAFGLKLLPPVPAVMP